MTTAQTKAIGALVGSLIKLAVVVTTGYCAWRSYKDADIAGTVYWSALWIGWLIPGRSAK